MRFILSASFLFLLSFNLKALTLADVPIAPSITQNDATLTLYGAGVRSKFFFKLYVGSLYAEREGLSAQALNSAEHASAIRLDIISDKITSERMSETVIDGFKAASKGNLVPLQTRLDQFLGVFNEAIVIGDRFTLVNEPNKGLHAYKNGKHLITIEGQDFAQTLFAIWLGENPADEKLKAQLLGN